MLTIRKLGTKRTLNVAVVRMPRVQPVHGRNCTCHRCAPAMWREHEYRPNVR